MTCQHLLLHKLGSCLSLQAARCAKQCERTGVAHVASAWSYPRARGFAEDGLALEFADWELMQQDGSESQHREH